MLKQPSKDWLLNSRQIYDRLGFEALNTEKEMDELVRVSAVSR